MSSDIEWVIFDEVHYVNDMLREVLFGKKLLLCYLDHIGKDTNFVNKTILIGI